VAAVGTILIPAMLKNGYSREYAGAVSSGGGTLGILIPPSNPMIMYASICNISVTSMFTAGFIPGFLVLLALCSVAYFQARHRGFKGDADQESFSWLTFFRAVKKGFFSLVTVVVVLGSIYTGFATPVEASIVAVIWALFVGKVINRSLEMKHVRMALREGAMICGAILIICGTSALFGRILTYEQAPERIANAVVAITTNKYLVLLMVVGVLYVLGMFMESLAMIILITPVILPVMGKLDIDPIQFGILLVIATQVGLLTPPLGVNLFIASKLAGTSVEKLSVAVLPYIAIMTLVVLLILFFPGISTWLPCMLGMG
jgi:C4-dicarboxylate transporter DctM subunit